jgi:Mg2+ and Co2+ transporter CorA
MTDDPIVQEVWRVRQELFAEHGNDLPTLVKALQRRQKACGRRLVRFRRSVKKSAR